MVFVLVTWSSTCVGSYMVVLKNGHRFSVEGYWEVSGQTFFYYNGGLVGISSAVIQEIWERPGVIRGLGSRNTADIRSVNSSKKLGKGNAGGVEDKKNGTAESAPAFGLKMAGSRKIQLETVFEQALKQFHHASEHHNISEKKKAIDALIHTSEELVELTTGVK